MTVKLRSYKAQNKIYAAEPPPSNPHVKVCDHILIMCDDCPCPVLCSGSVAGISGRPGHMTLGSGTPAAGRRCRRSDACVSTHKWQTRVRIAAPNFTMWITVLHKHREANARITGSMLRTAGAEISLNISHELLVQFVIFDTSDLPRNLDSVSDKITFLKVIIPSPCGPKQWKLYSISFSPLPPEPVLVTPCLHSQIMPDRSFAVCDKVNMLIFVFSFT